MFVKGFLRLFFALFVFFRVRSFCTEVVDVYTSISGKRI